MSWLLRKWWMEIFGLLGLMGSAAFILWMSRYTPHGAAKELVGFVSGLMGQGAEHAPVIHAKSAKAATAAPAGIDASSLQGWFASANAMAAASAMAIVRKIVGFFMWWLKVIAFLIVLTGVAFVSYFLGGYGKM